MPPYWARLLSEGMPSTWPFGVERFVEAAPRMMSPPHWFDRLYATEPSRGSASWVNTIGQSSVPSA